MAVIDTTPDLVRSVYERSRKNLGMVRDRLGRPLTLAEKIVFGHLADPRQELAAGEAYIDLNPDRVAMQDATAQMALLQFMLAGRNETAVPTTVHCDHLIRAHSGARADLENSLGENKEVFEFLRTASARYGIGFWKPGAGIIHQVILENYAFPGGLMIGTDSHTPNAGGLGMAAIGVGGADAVDVMAGFPWEVLQPTLIGVHLTGKLSGWAAPKDVILWVCGQLTVKGGTNAIVEYFGPGVRSISATGKATICNMGAELGATTSVFPFDDRMETYLRATRRGEIADLAGKNADLVTPDAEIETNPGKFFPRVLELDLSKLEPHLVGPHSPDLARPVSAMKEAVQKEGYPDRISVALIGSCTNSSYEDIGRAADVADQAADHGAKMTTPLMVTPGSEQIMATIQRDGQMQKLEKVGATVLANACGPCIGQWKRDEIKKGERNTIITSFNRNFPGRNDANPETMAFIGSPEIVIAYGLAGSLSFNPLTDTIKVNGKEWRLNPPKPAPDIPEKGFIFAREGFVPPPSNPESVSVALSAGSERLEKLEPFAPPKAEEFQDMPVLMKTPEHTTTDHISPAGPWLKYRGHLDKISDNMLTGGINAFTAKRGVTLNPLTGAADRPVPEVARALKAAGMRWVIVGGDNYGEGSSREHAAMSPRLLGAGAIIARSLARIHETNLKKQGLLPLTFVNSEDYDKVQATDTISLPEIAELAPGKAVTAVLKHADGRTQKIALRQTLNEEQIAWFWAGSALNRLREKERGKA